MPTNTVGRLETQKPRRTGLLAVLLDFLRLLKTGSWRRGGDSNPGYLAVRLISSQVHSTTLPPLREPDSSVALAITRSDALTFDRCRLGVGAGLGGSGIGGVL